MKLINLETLKGCCIIRPHGSEEIALTQKFSERLNHFEIPIIEAEPIKYGHWIIYCEDKDSPYHMKCSCCEAYWSDPAHAKYFERCYKCGAYINGTKMIGSEDND